MFKCIKLTARYKTHQSLHGSQVRPESSWYWESPVQSPRSSTHLASNYHHHHRHKNEFCLKKTIQRIPFSPRKYIYPWDEAERHSPRKFLFRQGQFLFVRIMTCFQPRTHHDMFVVVGFLTFTIYIRRQAAPSFAELLDNISLFCQRFTNYLCLCWNVNISSIKRV